MKTRANQILLYILLVGLVSCSVKNDELDQVSGEIKSLSEPLSVEEYDVFSKKDGHFINFGKISSDTEVTVGIEPISLLSEKVTSLRGQQYSKAPFCSWRLNKFEQEVSDLSIEEMKNYIYVLIGNKRYQLSEILSSGYAREIVANERLEITFESFDFSDFDDSEVKEMFIILKSVVTKYVDGLEMFQIEGGYSFYCPSWAFRLADEMGTKVSNQSKDFDMWASPEYESLSVKEVETRIKVNITSKFE